MSPDFGSHYSVFGSLPQGRGHEWVRWLSAAETNPQGADHTAEGSGAKGTPLISEGN